VDVKSKLGVRESGSGFAERSKIRPAGQRLKAIKLARRIPTFRHYTTLDGLPHRSIRDLLKRRMASIGSRPVPAWCAGI